ncbi:MAG: matrixin family metalloprotease [bacterium]|nr:matrixin family metalloprotease [bacterium]
MKRFLTFIFLIAALGAFGYQSREYFFPPKPCMEPIPYALGDFAPQFKITEKYFLDAIADAEAIWEEARGRELFTYSPEDDATDVLKMNLIYDYRQEATTKLGRIGSVLEDNQESYDILRSEFESLRRQYEKEKRDLEADIGPFNKRQDAYEAQVKYWNNKGGAPDREFEKLGIERRALEQAAAVLEKRQSELNKTAEEVNALVSELNTLAKKLNLSVEDYNTVNDSRGETFEEGLYVAEGREREINIYEFENRSELVRLLAHELGHALSLDHVADSEAIMYELNESENLKLTQADIAELNLRCGTVAD